MPVQRRTYREKPLMVAMSRDREFIALNLDDVACILGYASSQPLLPLLEELSLMRFTWVNELESGDTRMMTLNSARILLAGLATHEALALAQWLEKQYPDGKDLANLTPEAQRKEMLHRLAELLEQEPHLDAASLATRLNTSVADINAMRAWLKLLSRLHPSN